MVTERPILMSGPMVRALLAGTKTQTRRVVKLPHQNPLGRWEPQTFGGPNGGRLASGETIPEQGGIWHTRTGDSLGCPYGQPGDRLWVRETHYAWGHWTKRLNPKKRREEWHFVDETLGAGLSYRYEADEKLPRRKRELHEVGWWKRPAIFMPRAASRIMLEITEVRVQRLQEISEPDARAEGAPCYEDGIDPPPPDAECEWSYRASFRRLWESINGPGSWDANPWVWAITFRRIP